jgi:sigma54-dependent transcription regulator
MPTLKLTQVHLEPRQKAELQRRATANGTKVAEEIGKAVDAYLAGVTAEELERLDAATRAAKLELDRMAADLERVNRRVDAVLAEMDRVRAELPTLPGGARPLARK